MSKNKKSGRISQEVMSMPHVRYTGDSRPLYDYSDYFPGGHLNQGQIDVLIGLIRADMETERSETMGERMGWRREHPEKPDWGKYGKLPPNFTIDFKTDFTWGELTDLEKLTKRIFSIC